MKGDFQPDKKLVEQFHTLEKKIDAVLHLIARLKEENRQLQEELTKLEARRQNALQQLNNIIDKIEQLL